MPLENLWANLVEPNIEPTMPWFSLDQWLLNYLQIAEYRFIDQLLSKWANIRIGWLNKHLKELLMTFFLFSFFFKKICLWEDKYRNCALFWLWIDNQQEFSVKVFIAYHIEWPVNLNAVCSNWDGLKNWFKICCQDGGLYSDGNGGERYGLCPFLSMKFDWKWSCVISSFNNAVLDA